MKIVFIVNNLAGGGAERVAATLANFWVRQGWDVTLVTLATEQSDFYDLTPQVRRIGLNLFGESSNILFAGLQNVRRIMSLRKILSQLQPAIALSLMSTPNVLLAFASWGLPGICAVGSEHEYPPHAPLGFIWTRLRQTMYGKLDAVVALTQECAHWINNHSSAKSVPVIPNPIAWPFPDQLPRIEVDDVLPSSRRVLLAVGRLTAVKNLAVLIRVFGQIAARCPEWDVAILGEGPERASLESLVSQYGLADRIFLPGIAGNIGQWYERADLYVMTSHSEGFPNTLAEALAHGVPAVSFDCDTGPRDIIRNGVDGLLVPAGDSTALMHALQCLMQNDVLRKEFAGHALDARQRFSVEEIARRWTDLFATLAAASSSSPGINAASAESR